MTTRLHGLPAHDGPPPPTICLTCGRRPITPPALRCAACVAEAHRRSRTWQPGDPPIVLKGEE